ncbi:hypothetical protein NDU88_007564 [Pleurodeles waltl]|uniref:Uncharacterized protein n=1 Tax=Pleurodeles waltl TaxID=8319 RepID=A0AAV7U422_PLEWA|nr:hypothetical protein NDU88_007564 [Pleurodeles waltl]
MPRPARLRQRRGGLESHGGPSSSSDPQPPLGRPIGTSGALRQVTREQGLHRREAHHHKRSKSLQRQALTHRHPQPATNLSDKEHSTAMERMLQEITTVSRRIEGMDASITSLTLETKSMRSDIAGFQSRVTGLEQRMGSLEAQATTSQDRDQDLFYLRSKLTDMEDRSRRDYIRLLGIPENQEGTDMQAFLSSTLSKLTSLDFDSQLEFQWAHRVGPKHSDKSSRPRPITACLLRHNQTRQILQAARSHGPFRVDQHDIRITADYSKETNERRKTFLAQRPWLRQLETKYGLFDPTRMWVTKNRVSKDFYNPEELRLFLDSFQLQPMDSTSTNCPHDISGDNEGNRTFLSGMEKASTAPYDTDTSQRGRDMERLARSHDDRGQVLHALAAHTQLSERDKSRSPLKPTTVSS